MSYFGPCFLCLVTILGVPPATSFVNQPTTSFHRHSVQRARLIDAASEASGALRLKSLVFEIDGRELVLAVIASDDRVDAESLSGALAYPPATKVRLAPSKAATRASGSPMGSVPPVGLLTPLRTVIDARVATARGPVVGGAGGAAGSQRKRLLFDTAEELVSLASHPRVASIAIAMSVAGTARPPSPRLGNAIRGKLSALSSWLARIRQHPRWRRFTRQRSRERSRAQLPAIDCGAELVQFAGVVSSKRRLARTLCFVSLIPFPELLPPEAVAESAAAAARNDAGATHEARRLWRPVGLPGRGARGLGAEGRGDRSHGAPGSWLSGGVEIQLIVGKTLERRVGADAMVNIIKSLRVGHRVLVLGAHVDDDDGETSHRQRRRLSRGRQLGLRCVEITPLNERGSKGIPGIGNQIPSPPPLTYATASSPPLELPPTPTLESAPRPTLRLRQPAPERCNEKAGRSPYFTLPARVPIILVDDAVSLARLRSALDVITVKAEEHARHARLSCDATSEVTPRSPPVLAIDVEWRPRRTPAIDGRGGEWRASVLQLATRDACFIVDLFAHGGRGADDADADAMLFGDGGAGLDAALSGAFGSENLRKLALGASDDIRVLRRSYPAISAFHDVRSVVDMRSLARVALVTSAPNAPAKGSLTGLSQITNATLGRNLDKTLQCSPWQRRPLTSDMMMYAAIDAFVLVEMFDRLHARLCARPHAQHGAADARIRGKKDGGNKRGSCDDNDGPCAAKRVVMHTANSTQMMMLGARSPAPELSMGPLPQLQLRRRLASAHHSGQQTRTRGARVRSEGPAESHESYEPQM